MFDSFFDWFVKAGMIVAAIGIVVILTRVIVEIVRIGF